MQRQRMRIRLIVAIFVIIGLIGMIGLVLTQAQDKEPVTYHTVKLDDDSTVYDGDTIQDVHIEIYDFGKNKYPQEIIFPGVLIENNKLFMITDIRLAGIDTPEKRPKKKGRTEESLEKEKAAAAEARDVLRDLLAEHDFIFLIANPQLGKYAGRIVCDVYIGEDKLDVDEHLIEQGYGYYYDGKTKQEFDDWYKQ